jgi:hypothetical protein
VPRHQESQPDALQHAA